MREQLYGRARATRRVRLFLQELVRPLLRPLHKLKTLCLWRPPRSRTPTVRTSPFSSFCFFVCFVCFVFSINLTLFVSATACDYAFRSTAPEHCSTRYTGSNSLPLAAAPRTDANAVHTSSSSFSCFFVCFVCFVFSSMVNLTLFVSAAGCVSAFLNTSGVRLLAERF